MYIILLAAVSFILVALSDIFMHELTTSYDVVKKNEYLQRLRHESIVMLDYAQALIREDALIRNLVTRQKVYTHTTELFSNSCILTYRLLHESEVAITVTILDQQGTLINQKLSYIIL